MSKSKRKDKTVKYQIGKLCPKCLKGKLQHCSLGTKTNDHKGCRHCPTCNYTNF